MNILQTLEKSTLNNLVTLFATGLLFWISITVFLPTLPAYIQHIGARTEQVGIVMGCFAIGLLLSRSKLGQIADQRSRKIVVQIGIVVAATAPFGYMLVQSIPMLMVIRAFHGISIAAFSTGYSALVVDLSPEKNRGELIGYMSLAVSVGMALGPALGGYIESAAGYTTLFLFSGTSAFLALLLSTKVKEACREDIIANQKNHSGQINRNFWQLLQTPSLLVLSLILLLIGLVFGTLVTFLPLYIKDSQLDLNAGLFYTTAALSGFIGRIITGKASDRYGRGLFITGSIFCYGLAMLLLTYAQTPVGFLLGAISEGIGGGIVFPMMIALMSDRCYPGERGKVYSICIGGFDLGVAIAGPFMGIVASIYGYASIFAIAASLSFLALLIFVTMSNKNISHSLRFAIGKDKDIYAL